jgi:hypothetical protein
MIKSIFLLATALFTLNSVPVFAEKGAPSTRPTPTLKDGKPNDVQQTSRDRLNQLKDLTTGGVSTGGKVVKPTQTPAMPVLPGAPKPSHTDGKAAADTKATDASNPFLSTKLKKDADRSQGAKTKTDPSVFKSVDIGIRTGKADQDIANLKKVLSAAGADANAIEAKVDAILAKVGGKDNLEAKLMLMETMAAEAKSVADFNLKSDGKEKAEFNSKAILEKIEALAEAINGRIIDPKQRAQILSDIVISYSDIPNHKKRGSDGTGFLELALMDAVEKFSPKSKKALDQEGLDGYLALKRVTAEIYNKARNEGADFAKARELARQGRLNMLSEHGVALKWVDKDGKEHNFCECDGTCST